MTPEQITGKMAERIAGKIKVIATKPTDTLGAIKLKCGEAAKAELQPLADLIRLIEAQDQLLACYRMSKRPSEKLFDSLRKGRAALEKLGSI